MSRRLWIGFEITVMSTPPILAASSAFSIVVGEGLWRAPMFLWNCVPVKAAMSSGGRTCTWKSMIMFISALSAFLMAGFMPAIHTFPAGATTATAR